MWKEGAHLEGLLVWPQTLLRRKAFGTGRAGRVPHRLPVPLPGCRGRRQSRSPQNGPSHLLPPCTCPGGHAGGPGPACTSTLSAPASSRTLPRSQHPEPAGKTPKIKRPGLAISLLELHFPTRPAALVTTCHSRQILVRFLTWTWTPTGTAGLAPKP